MLQWRHPLRHTLTFVGMLAFAAPPPPARAFEFNGRHWDEWPIELWVDPERLPPGVELEQALGWVQSAAAQWTQVSCSNAAIVVSTAPAGGWAADGIRSIFWISQGWYFLPTAAGATLWIPTLPGEPQEVDVALNAEHYAWIAGGGDALQSGVVDPVSVLAHELGHVLGLSHSAEPHATMFQALLPNGVQASLDVDDKWGLCTLYPDRSAPPECSNDDDCKDFEACALSPPYALCGDVRDGAGSPCHKDWLNCAGLCLISLWECSQICAFTAEDYSDGYCAPLCGPGHPACPVGWSCYEIDAWGGSACFQASFDPKPRSDERPERPHEEGDRSRPTSPDTSPPSEAFRHAVQPATGLVCAGNITHLVPPHSPAEPGTPPPRPEPRPPEPQPKPELDSPSFAITLHGNEAGGKGCQSPAHTTLPPWPWLLIGCLLPRARRRKRT